MAKRKKVESVEKEEALENKEKAKAPKKKTSKSKKKAGSQTIIITEKPNASMRIAEALAGGRGKAERKENREAYWYEFKKGREKFVVISAVGHIYALDTVKDGKGWTYPTFNVHWIPSFNKKGSEFSEKYFRNLEDVVKNGAKNKYIVATDYDTEGSVIGYNVLKFMCDVEDAERMKYSTLTRDELIESFEKRSKHLDFGQVESGLTRHYLDFFWGINLTRALTLAMKNAAKKGFAILSTGRVQGPTLAMLLDKELAVRRFKSKPYWQLELHLKVGGAPLVAQYEKEKIWKKADAQKIVKDCKGKDAVVKDIKKRVYKQTPPIPFNTTALQSESFSQFKYSPRQTLGIAESLYQAGYISYPRSSSQKLPPSINYKRIIESLSKMKSYSKFAKALLEKKELVPNEGKRTDPAHPAVYPTFETADLSKLNSAQKKIYDLIVRRFLAVFGDPATRESNRVNLDVNKHKFFVIGRRIIEPGWTAVYKKYLSFEEQTLPEMKVGDKLTISKLLMLDKETQPPGRYSQGSILKVMEEKGLGTRATRAEILQTLYTRKYVMGKSIEVTKLGEVVTKVLKDFCPRILSEEMTRRFEKNTDLVAEGKKKRDDVVNEAKKLLEEVLKDFKKNEKKIGKKLLKGLTEARVAARTLGKCPNCEEGELRVIVSKKSGKRFVGCSSYPKCHTGFPLPQRGYITPLRTLCKECNLPNIQVQRKAARPYRMCINHKCKTKADWGKKKKAKDKAKGAGKEESKEQPKEEKK